MGSTTPPRWRWPTSGWRWAASGGLAGLAAVGYLGGGVAVIGPEQVGVVQRWGRYRELLGPGLHLRFPPPWEVVTIVEPDLIRVARVGLAGPPAVTSGPV